MRYQPIARTDFGFDKIDALIANSDANYAHLRKIDKQAKENHFLLWRYFTTMVADGYAYYQIVKVNKTNVHVARCKGIALDEYADDILGEWSVLNKARAEQLIANRDFIEKSLEKH